MSKKFSDKKMPEKDIADTLENIRLILEPVCSETITSLAELVFSNRNINLALVGIFAQLVAIEKKLANPDADISKSFAQDAIDKINELKQHNKFAATFIQPGQRG